MSRFAPSGRGQFSPRPGAAPPPARLEPLDPRKGLEEGGLRLRARGVSPAGARIYIACEAMAMRRLRHLLIDELGVPKAQVIGRGYWKLGEVNHPDHDYGDD